jgi:hypothetical protein
MLLRDFSGGLNTRIAPSLLQPNEAQVFTNIDATTGSILPWKDSTLYQASVNKYFTYYNHLKQVVSSAVETTFVEWNKILYSSSVGLPATKYDGVHTYNLGIIGPPQTFVGGVGSTGILTGTYTYIYTYYNSADDTESVASNVTTGIVVSNNNIYVNNIIASTDPQVNKIRLYRIGGALPNFTLVVELSNATQGYTDNKSDISIAGNHTFNASNYYPPQTGLKFLVEAYGMLFGAIGNTLYYSAIGTPNYWPKDYYIDFITDITAIAPLSTGILIFTSSRTYIVTGNTPDTFQVSLFDMVHGCVSHYTINYVANSLVWLSADGICSTTGGAITILSLPKLGNFDITGLQNSGVYNSCYYIVLGIGILVFDFRFNLSVRLITDPITWIGVFNNKVYGQKNGGLYELNSGLPLKYHWKSPVLTEGQYTTRKYWRDLFIKYNGSVTLNLYVDGRLVNTKDFEDNKCFNLKALSSSDGYGLEIELIGTAEISEINYSVTGGK